MPAHDESDLGGGKFNGPYSRCQRSDVRLDFSEQTAEPKGLASPNATMVGMTVRLVIDRLAWDDWNRVHVREHGVTIDEVEEMIARRPAGRATYKGRTLLVGPTSAGRMLAVAVGPVPREEGAFYVFSARPASRKERRLFDHEPETEGGAA